MNYTVVTGGVNEGCGRLPGTRIVRGMKTYVQKVVAYYRDNPHGYWFKRKLYGYGWTPVTREGWAVTIGIILLVILNAVRVELMGYPESAILWQAGVPTLALIALLLVVTWRTGEPLRWQWGPPKHTDQD